MDHCTTTSLFEDVTRANKQPVIHGMIITHFMSAKYQMSPFLSTNANSNKGTNHCGASLRVCAASGSDCDDNGIFCFYAAKSKECFFIVSISQTPPSIYQQQAMELINQVIQQMIIWGKMASKLFRFSHMHHFPVIT